MNPDDDPPDVQVSARLGARLRDLRRQLHLSLQDVEVASHHEFKASVVSAYKRGDRAITVRRLQRLARLYRVPVAEMVPHDEEHTPPAIDPPLTIDLVALHHLAGPHGELLGDPRDGGAMSMYCPTPRCVPPSPTRSSSSSFPHGP